MRSFMHRNQITDVDDARLRVPASARAPDRQRFPESLAIDDDGEKDLQLLASLAQEVERVDRHEHRPATAPGRRAGATVDDEMEAFRQTLPELRRSAVLPGIAVEEVEMDDLLEQLSTTAAALRRRRAA